jgi:hypothetical protein
VDALVENYLSMVYIMPLPMKYDEPKCPDRIIKKERPTRNKSSLNNFFNSISQSLDNLKQNTERKGKYTAPDGKAGGKRKTRGKRITGKKTRSNRR